MAAKVEVLTFQCCAGDPVHNVGLFLAAHEECAELQTQPARAWLGKTLHALQSVGRTEVLVRVNGENAGGGIIARGFDPHVGECIEILCQYVLPEFRNMGVSARIMRKAVKLAKGSVLAYTHRIGDWKYLTQYRRINAFT